MVVKPQQSSGGNSGKLDFIVSRGNLPPCRQPFAIGSIKQFILMPAAYTIVVIAYKEADSTHLCRGGQFQPPPTTRGRRYGKM